MKKLTVKLIFASMLAFLLTSFIVIVLWRIFGGLEPVEQADRREIMSFMAPLTSFLSILFFGIIVNRVVIKRVNHISHATQEIMVGNYDVEIKDKKVDELSALADNFNLMVESLRKNEYVNKEFVRNFSHEIKTPLAAIKGYADYLNTTELTEKEQKEYLSIISKETSRLSSLSKSMLLISLVDSQNIVRKQDTYNVTEQIRNVIQLTQLDWESKKIDLELDLPDITVTLNKELTYHIWMNLFTNAVTYSNDDTTITLSIQQNDHKLRFEITNQGLIDKMDQEHIFDLFYVADKSRNKQSSGVGLSVTKTIVEKLEGTVSFSSNDNKTTFVVELPI